MDVYISNDPIARIDNLVNNFEKIDFGRHLTNRNFKQSVKNFTNFSVSEILKPNHKGHFYTGTFDSDSDGTCSMDSSEHYSSDPSEHYSSDPSEHYSSGEETYQSNEAGRRLSQSPEYIHNFEAAAYQRCPHQILRHKTCRVLNEEDGFSSDASENETALDLRIQRKKTPPKMTRELPAWVFLTQTAPPETTNELPAWVFCTRYSDRPSAGPRVRKPRQKPPLSRRRNRTAFNSLQIHHLTKAFEQDPYLSETRRAHLANELDLNEASVKIWFQNQRAKSKKDRAYHPLAVRLAQDGLYNHKTVANQ